MTQLVLILKSALSRHQPSATSNPSDVMLTCDVVDLASITDFIFTLFSEEFGFFGSLFILLLYTLIISRIIKIGNITRSNFGKLYCYGFATAFFIYVVVNMMMVLGLLPIVGSPLPIMSYGGSSMLATMIGFGIVLSAKINHKQTIS